MKRLVPLALAVALGAAACGSSSGGSSSNTTAASSATTASSGSATTSGGSSGSVDMKTGNPPAPVSLSEDGSSLLEPYLASLVTPLKTAYSNITLSPAAGGSGKGISDAISGTVDMGGSDAYLSPSQAQQNPSLANIPIAVSSQAVNYNLPGVTGNLKLSGDVLAQMYEGKITSWNDPAIAKLNPGVTLPSTKVVPVRRVDSSGDTFIFTNYLSATNQTWANGPSVGTTVTWPSVGNELTASGNPGMVQTCSATPGCVAYIGISAEASAQTAKLGQAMLQNKSGQFVLPTSTTVTAAVNASTGNVPANLAASLIYASGAQSYPIVNFEYIVVKSDQSDTNKAMAIRTFLAWAISTSGGSAPQYLSAQHFEPLPTSVVPKVQAAIAKIGG